MVDLRAIRAANPLPSIVGETVKLQRAGNEWKGCCPFHADRSPSFTIFADGERFHCFGCGASGDVFDFVQRLHCVGLTDAAAMLGAGQLPKVVLPVFSPSEKVSRTPQAQAIFNKATAAAGTPVETYLRSRGINPPFPPDIRVGSLPCGKSEPLLCLVAGVRDVTAELTGIHRVYLRSDGSGKANLREPKLSLGKIAGGAIRLGEIDDTGVITVCEGLEDGLSLFEVFGGPVWVACGTSNLPKMQFPPEVGSVIIGGDNDEAGIAAARKAAAAYAGRGLSVRIIYPLPSYKDFNDELIGEQK